MSSLKKLIMMANQAEDEREYPPYLCFEALEDGFQASFSGENCEYSLDRIRWVMLSPSEKTPQINAGDRIYFRNSSPVQPNSIDGIGKFSSSRLFNIYGRVTSMLYGDDFMDFQSVDINYVFASMFQNNKKVCRLDDEFFNIGICNGCRIFNNCFFNSSVITAKIPCLESLNGYTFTGVFNSSALEEITISDDYIANLSDLSSAFANSKISSLIIPRIKGGVYTCYAIAKDCTRLNDVLIKGGVYSTGSFDNAFKGCSSLKKVTALYTANFLNKSTSSNWLNGVNEQGVMILNKNITWNPHDIINGNTDANGEVITWGIPAGWEVKYCDPDNPDDVRDNKEDFYPQEINTILESIITGEELDNMDSLLQQISQSQEDMSSINTQLENIINT